VHSALEHGEQVFNAYNESFSGFTGDEMPILDGIIPD